MSDSQCRTLPLNNLYTWEKEFDPYNPKNIGQHLIFLIHIQSAGTLPPAIY